MWVLIAFQTVAEPQVADNTAVYAEQLQSRLLTLFIWSYAELVQSVVQFYYRREIWTSSRLCY